MKLKLIPIYLVLFVCAACDRVTTGTAEGFGGDGPYTDKLINVRDTILKPTVTHLKQGGGDPQLFCDFSTRCPDSSNPLCATVLTLTIDQKKTCQNFLFRNLGALEVQMSNPMIPLEATYDPLVVNGFEVAAMTSLDTEGKILVNIDHVKTMTDIEIASLLIHEYLHKLVDVLFGFIQDALFYPQIPQPSEIPMTGAALNTSAGLEVAFQAKQLELIQDLPPATSNITISALRNHPENSPALDGTTINFGTQPRFSLTTAVITLRNDGNAPATNFGATSPALPFQLAADASTCSSAPVNPGGSCTFVITFRPLERGEYSNLVTFTYHDGVRSISRPHSLVGKTPLQ